MTEIEVCETPQIIEIKREEVTAAPISAKDGEIQGADGEIQGSEVKLQAKEEKTRAPKPQAKADKAQAKEDKLKAKGASLAKRVNFEKYEWKGYSYNELRLQTLLMRTRIDLNKSMMMSRGQMFMQKKSKPVTMLGRMLGALDYLDYGVLAYKLGRTIFKLFRR
ncbi:MAG: hypothetical protein NC102_04685 [Clostridium sp.]|nr:hypothetical protein [Clostridium sp.]